MKRIYVGNLPFSTTEGELRDMFTAYGTVHSASVITDRVTGRSRGFGFIEMDDSDADQAINAVNGTEVGGRSLRVNEAHERERRRGPGGR